jgi:hypothetical protein
MKNIIGPVERTKLIKELTSEKFEGYTNKNKNEIYIFDYRDSPDLMLEVARLREESFRSAGGGTGNLLDIDIYDMQSKPYKQLIVWNPEDKEIIGGYRFALANEVSARGRKLSNLVINTHFELSNKFIRNYLPYSIELGRAFVQPRYQSKKAGNKSLFALDNLWDGLGVLIVKYPQIKFFYGKVTIFSDYNLLAKELLLNFMHEHFEDYSIMRPKNQIHFHNEETKTIQQFGLLNFEEEFKSLNSQLRNMGITIPPLINSYIRLSPTLKVFGAYHDNSFGNVDEVGIMITIADIYPNKVERHVKAYLKEAVMDEV